MFVVNPYKANNLFSDNYKNSLASLQRVEFSLFQM